MSASRQRSGARRRIKITPLRIVIVTLIALLAVGGGLVHLARNWRPSRARYPVQGITVSAANGAVSWRTARAAGVDFAYLVATTGSDERDDGFAANLADARAAGLRVGAIHRYSLCRSATAQATRFIATVPRDAAMLPPVVALALRPDCPARPSREALLAELTIFLNQIEAGSGKPAVLRISHDFEARYEISGGINRTLWLTGNFFPPGYATRPWVMWTASTWAHVPGIDGPVDWDVVRP